MMMEIGIYSITVAPIDRTQKESLFFEVAIMTVELPMECDVMQ